MNRASYALSVALALVLVRILVRRLVAAPPMASLSAQFVLVGFVFAAGTWHWSDVPWSHFFAAFLAVYNRTNPAIRDAAGNLVPGGGAFHPRLPRYVNSEQDTERAGGSLSLTWKPGENTTLSLDGLFSRYQQERRDNYILGLSFGRNLSNNGQPMTSIRAVEFDDNGSMTYGLFDGVDVRSEGLVDQFVSTFKQGSLTLDHQINDSFGHDAGDKVLRSIAQVLSGCVRIIDIVARVGGEEFAVILPHTDAQGAHEVAQRMRAAVAQASWLSQPTTISIGAASLRTAETACSLYARADAALYAAKNSGRNRLVAG